MPFASNHGVKLHYEVQGRGRPLFLHIGAVAEWDLWKLGGYPERLKGYRLIMNDPRGRGESGRPKTLADHKLEKYADDVTAILDDLGIERAAFWGHSDGARVGYMLGRRHPKRTTAIIACGGHDIPDEFKIWRVDFAKLARKEGMGTFDKFFTEAMGHDYPSWYKKKKRDRDVRMLELEMLAWKPWIYNMGMYSKIRVPTLVMTGEKEDPDGISAEICKRLPHGELAMLPGLDHMGAFLRSDVTVPVATKFLQKHRK